MMKKIPQRLVNKIEKYNLSVQGESLYKEILAGNKEEFLLSDKAENNIFVHVGTGAQLDLNGSTKDVVFILEPDATVNYFLKRRNEIINSKKISAIVSSGAKFNLILSARDEVESNLKITFVLVGAYSSVNIEEAISAVNIAETNRDVLINHLASGTESSYFARTIVDDSAKIAIKIKTIIAIKASKSIARQRIDNLILSDKATVKGWPQLEINNNDVVCTHALTTGHLNEDEVFYTESRGIGKQKALAMIAEGFLRPIVDKFSNSDNKTI